MCDRQKKEHKHGKSGNLKPHQAMQHHHNQDHKHKQPDDSQSDIYSGENRRAHRGHLNNVMMHTHHHRHPKQNPHHAPKSSSDSSSASSTSSTSSGSSSSLSSSFSSSFSSSSITSSSSTSLSSESSGESSSHHGKPQHSQSFTDISRKHGYFEEDDDTAPLITKRGHPSRSSAKENRDMENYFTPPPTVGMKNKKTCGGMSGSGCSRRAKSMEDLTTRNIKSDNGAEEGQDQDNANNEARKNLKKEKMKFSAFLNEITRQVLSPMRLTSLGVTDAQRPCSPGQVSARSRETDSSSGKPTHSRSRAASADSVSSSKHSHTSRYSHSSRASHSKRSYSSGHHSASPSSQMRHQHGSCCASSPTSEHQSRLTSSKHHHRNSSQHNDDCRSSSHHHHHRRRSHCHAHKHPTNSDSHFKDSYLSSHHRRDKRNTSYHHHHADKHLGDCKSQKQCYGDNQHPSYCHDDLGHLHDHDHDNSNSNSTTSHHHGHHSPTHDNGCYCNQSCHHNHEDQKTKPHYFDNKDHHQVDHELYSEPHDEIIQHPHIDQGFEHCCPPCDDSHNPNPNKFRDHHSHQQNEDHHGSGHHRDHLSLGCQYHYKDHHTPNHHHYEDQHSSEHLHHNRDHKNTSHQHHHKDHHSPSHHCHHHEDHYNTGPQHHQAHQSQTHNHHSEDQYNSGHQHHCGDHHSPSHHHDRHHKDHHSLGHQHHSKDQLNLSRQHHQQSHHNPTHQFTHKGHHSPVPQDHHQDHHSLSHSHHSEDQHSHHQHHHQHHYAQSHQHQPEDHHSPNHKHQHENHSSPNHKHKHDDHHSPSHQHQHKDHHSFGTQHHNQDYHSRGHHHHQDHHSPCHQHHHQGHHSPGHQHHQKDHQSPGHQDHHQDHHDVRHNHHPEDQTSPGHKHHQQHLIPGQQHQHKDNQSTNQLNQHELQPGSDLRRQEDYYNLGKNQTESQSDMSHSVDAEQDTLEDKAALKEHFASEPPSPGEAESLATRVSPGNPINPFSQDEEQTSFSGASPVKVGTHDVSRIMILQDSTPGLHHSLLKTAVRMECLGEEFISSQRLIENELQRTRMELSNLMERFKRLHDDCSSTQQTNNLLEQKLQLVLQNMEGERERLNLRISELTEQLTDAKISSCFEEINASSVLHEVPLHAQSIKSLPQAVPPIAPPPAQFMDSHNTDKTLAQEQSLGSVPEEEESDWSEVGEETPQLILKGPTRVQAWRHQETDIDKDTESGSDDLLRGPSPRPLQIPHLQFTMHNDFVAPGHAGSCPSGFKNLPDDSSDGERYGITKCSNLIRSASLEDIPLMRHHTQKDLHHSSEEAIEELESGIIYHWRLSNNGDTVIRRLTNSRGPEVENSLASLHSAELMLSHFICDPDDGGELGRAEVHGWTGGIRDEVLQGERTHL